MLLLPLPIAADTDAIPPTQPIRAMMATLVTPHSDAIWAAGAKAYDEPGSPEAFIDDATWANVEKSRLTLGDVAEALLVTGRPVDAAGARSPDPAAELHPEQVAALIAAKPDQWAAAVASLSDAAKQLQKPIADHDVIALAAAGDVLYETCAGCHQAFWYPQK